MKEFLSTDNFSLEGITARDQLLAETNEFLLGYNARCDVGDILFENADDLTAIIML